MSCLQVSTLLHRVREFHHRAAEYFNHQATASSNQPAVAVFEYAAWHELLIERTIREILSDLSPRTATAWVSTTCDIDHLADEIGVAVGPSGELTSRDAQQVVAAIDSLVIRVYQELVDGEASDPIRKVFRELLNMEEQQARRIAAQTRRKAVPYLSRTHGSLT